MNGEEFARKIEQIRKKLYKTALLYFGEETIAIDVLDQSVYKALQNYRKLRNPQYFDTWITRILLNCCHDEKRRRKRLLPLEELPETAVEEFDSLPLKEAISCLPKELKEVIILRFFSQYTLKETAETLEIPKGTVVTRQRKALLLLRLELGEGEEE